MIFLTTTAVDIDEELLNRCLVLTVDEGREQTAAIHRLQRERETLAGLLRKETRNQILVTHRVRVDYIAATLDDIAAANWLAHHVLGRCLDEMPPQTRRLLELIERMVAQRCAEKKLERSDVLFSRRQVREFTGWGDTQLKVHLERLAELEYVLTHRADHGQGHVYELVYDGAGKDGGRFLPGLLDVEKLRAVHGYDAQRSGQNGERSGAGRPPVGGWSASGRGAGNGVSSSEKSPGAASTRENAHLDDAVLAVAS